MTTSTIYIEIGNKVNQWVDVQSIIDAGDVNRWAAQVKPLQFNSLMEFDYLVTDCMGLAKHFHDGWESFDLDGYTNLINDLANNDIDEEVAIGYIENCGEWNLTHCMDAYCGHWERDNWSAMKNYAYEIFSEGNEIPEHLINYIDWDMVERDFDMEHWEHEGHIFCSC